MGVNFIRNIKFGYFKKIEKSEYRRKQLKSLSICVQIQELIKINIIMFVSALPKMAFWNLLSKNLISAP